MIPLLAFGNRFTRVLNLLECGRGKFTSVRKRYTFKFTIKIIYIIYLDLDVVTVQRIHKIIDRNFYES